MINHETNFTQLALTNKNMFQPQRRASSDLAKVQWMFASPKRFESANVISRSNDHDKRENLVDPGIQEN